jgi:hypothetical protein
MTRFVPRFPIAETITAPQLADFPSSDNSAEPEARGLNLGNLPFDIYYTLCTKYLPPDTILNIASLTKSLRALLLPNLNSFALQHLLTVKPYYLPILVPPPTPRGDAELIQWNDAWSRHSAMPTSTTTSVQDFSQWLHDVPENTVPWFQYLVECGKSRSMRNRRRIWSVVGEIGELAAAYEKRI